MRVMVSFSGLPYIKIPPAKANNYVSSPSEVQSICKCISTLEEHRCYCTQEKAIEDLRAPSAVLRRGITVRALLGLYHLVEISVRLLLVASSFKIVSVLVVGGSEI